MDINESGQLHRSITYASQMNQMNDLNDNFGSALGFHQHIFFAHSIVASPRRKLKSHAFQSEIYFWNPSWPLVTES